MITMLEGIHRDWGINVRKEVMVAEEGKD